MHKVVESEAAQGMGLFLIAVAGALAVWYLVGYLLGDTDKARTPAQNLHRRIAGAVHWWVCILMAGLHGMDAAMEHYYKLRSKAQPMPRNEAARVPAELTPQTRPGLHVLGRRWGKV